MSFSFWVEDSAVVLASLECVWEWGRRAFGDGKEGIWGGQGRRWGW